MKTQKVTIEFQVSENFKLTLATGTAEQKIKVDDIIVLNPHLTHPIYFIVENVKNDEDDNVDLFVSYFGSFKVLKRASMCNASIVPLAEFKLNYQAITICLMANEQKEED